MRKPTPPPKVPALVRRSVAAAAVGLGVGGAACGGSIEGTPGMTKPATDASDASDAGSASNLGDAGVRSDASLGAESGLSVSSEDAGAAQDSATQDTGTDTRIPPPLPPLPPPPPLPPK